MSRSRNLKPGFFKNEELAELSFEYRILFQGLWCLADRAGRLEDRPKRIKAEVFPYDDVHVSVGLDQLHKAGFITRYEVGGVNYIEVVSFTRHQNPHVKETASTIPAPCKSGASSGNSGASTADSLNPITDSPIPSKAPAAPVVRVSRFDEFWTAYPEKKGRSAAEKAWKRKGLDAIADQILAHVARMKAEDEGWRDGYIPHGSTYVNGERWHDEPRRRRTGTQAAPQDSKTLTGMKTLQGMKDGLVFERDHRRADEAHVLGAGSDARRRLGSDHGRDVD